MVVVVRLLVLVIAWSAGALAGCHREPEPAQKASVLSLGAGPGTGASASAHQRPPTVVPRVLGSMVHDRAWFTQGLAFWEGRLFEGTGMYGESLVHEIDPHTGSEVRRVADDALLFGEGITVFRGELYQLTWKEHECEVFDPNTLRKRRELAYDGEGWGITSDGDFLVTSDGSDTLSYRDPESFRVVRAVAVTFAGEPLLELNELENVRGEIWANVWQTDFIVRIAPSTGRVIGRLDLAGIQSFEERSRDADDVLNGIAFDERGGRVLITGKRWARLFEIGLPAVEP